MLIALALICVGVGILWGFIPYWLEKDKELARVFCHSQLEIDEHRQKELMHTALAFLGLGSAAVCIVIGLYLLFTAASP